MGGSDLKSGPKDPHEEETLNKNPISPEKERIFTSPNESDKKLLFGDLEQKNMLDDQEEQQINFDEEDKKQE